MSSEQVEDEKARLQKMQRRNRLAALALIVFAALMIILTMTLPKYFAAANAAP